MCVCVCVCVCMCVCVHIDYKILDMSFPVCIKCYFYIMVT